MAEDINKPIDNSQSTARNFSDGNWNAARREADRQDERLSYANTLRAIKNLEQKKKELENNAVNTLKVIEESYDKIEKYNDNLINKEKELEEAKKSGNDSLVEKLEKQIEYINDEVKAEEDHIKIVQEHHQALKDSISASQRAIEEDTRILKDTYGVSVEAYEALQDIETEFTDEMNRIKEAQKVIQSSISEYMNEINDLYAEIAELDEDQQDVIDSKREQIEKIKEKLREAKETKDDLDDHERATKRQAHRYGISDLDERDTRTGRAQDNFTNVGGNIGAMVGSAFGPVGSFLGQMAGSALAGGGAGAKGAFTDAAENGEIPEAIESIIGELGGIGELIDIVKNVANICEQIRQQAGTYINQAASQLASYFGTIKANLENSSYTYKAISEKADNFLTTSRWVKQTDYLSKIAELSNNGLLVDIETAAMLQTIKDKTLTSFNATNEGIQRLIRLGESDYIRQFGLEMQLKRVLNSVFNDSGYLQSMFDSVTNAIMDAASSYSGDTTAFNSTVQTWLGYMYSSGLSSGVITKIADGINNLGSGNVSALASDESTQRLFLLAMDRAGLEYADILQQGLSLSDTNALLSSIVQYLDEISGNTENNLVLRSSYAQLFNLSVSDMQAIHNLSSQISSISSNAVSSSGAAKNTAYALNKLVEQNTTASEQFENLFSNLQYTFGESIAQSDALYSAFRISQETIKILQPFVELGGGIGTAAKIGQRAAGIRQYPILADGFIHLIADSAQSVFNNTVGGGLNSFLTSYMEGDTTAAETAVLQAALATYTSSSTSNNSSNINPVRTLISGPDGNGGLIQQMSKYEADESWDKEAEGDDVKILKEMAKTLMQKKTGGGYAFAVSLEGMNEEVLRSFASIFADEDAMQGAFDGSNQALSDKLYGYLDDSTNNKGNKT